MFDKSLLKTLCDQFDRVESSGANYIRYTNGIQICWNEYVQFSGKAGDHNYPIAFASSPALVVTLRGDVDSHSSFTVHNDATHMGLFTEKATSGSFTYIAFGRWK